MSSAQAHRARAPPVHGWQAQIFTPEMRLTLRRIFGPYKEANTIDDFKAVPSSLDISKYLKEFLIMCDPVKYPPGDSAKIVRRLNDTLQGRGEQTVAELLAEMDAVCGRLGIYNSEWCMFRDRIEDFQRQKSLLGQPYTKSSDKQYKYRSFDLDPNRPLKIVNQRLYDQAAKAGFPPNFFRETFFNGVTFYCIPDHTDFNFSRFSNCTFAVCRIREATFDGTSFSSSEFHSCAIQYATFFDASIVHTHFHDSTLRNVSFQKARLKSCNTVDCELEGVGFLNAALDGCFFGRVAAHGIRHLHTATITQGGATDGEVKRNREAIFAALRPEQGARQELPTKKRGGR